MPWGLKRYQQARHLHFITFCCYHRAPHFNTPEAKNTFMSSLEGARRWYGFYVVGYVVMPEHIHLLMSEPERSNLAVAVQMMKQIVSRKAKRPNARDPFWQPRYYDFNVWSERKRMEKLRYIHNNPVKRGLVASPEDWGGAVLGITQVEKRVWWRSNHGGLQNEGKLLGYIRRFVA